MTAPEFTTATEPPAVGGPVQRPVRPCAWIDANGYPHHLSYVQGVRERRLYGPLEPLYDGQTLWNACALAGEVEREKLRAKLLEMHERDKLRHNYWKCAAVELFGGTGEAAASTGDRFLAPIEPTTAMLYAMAEVDGFRRGDRDHPGLERWRDYWRAALAGLGA